MGVFQLIFYLLLLSTKVRTVGPNAQTDLEFRSLLPSFVLSTISLSLGQNKAHTILADYSSSFAQKCFCILACLANTLSSQILLTNLFLLINDLPRGPFALYLTLFLLPPLFAQLRVRLLPRCFPNLTHNSDLREEDKGQIDKILELINFRAFIQCLQLQTSKFKVNGRFVQNRSHNSLFKENLLSHTILQFLSTTLVFVYAFGANEDPAPPTEVDFSLHLPSVALTGSPALFNFLMASYTLAPVLWIVSQLLLIVYFWLDKGAMTCGLDFEFCSESDTESETKRDNKTKSLITGEEQISDETFVDLKILEKLYVSAFNLVSEEGRWVDPQFDGDVEKAQNYHEMEVLESLFRAEIVLIVLKFSLVLFVFVFVKIIIN